MAATAAHPPWPSAPAPIAPVSLLLARQPIFDRDERVVAYALLHAGGSAADDATDQLLVDTALGGGVEQVTDGRPAHLKVSPALLTSPTIQLLDPRRLALELRTDAVADDTVRSACRALALSGYDLVLDRFAYTEQAASLLPHVRMIKVDLREHGPATLTRLAAQVRPFGVRLLAEHADNRAVRDACLRLGFELFQGYRFTQPEVLARRDLPIQHVQTFKLLKELRDPLVHESAIEESFRRDVTLSYKLLRMVNSAALGGRGVWSIGHAIRLLGREALSRWVTLLLLSSVSDGGVQAELTYTSLLRGRFCELLAGPAGMRPAAGPLFMVGVFSLLDLIMGNPMADVVSQLEVDEEVAAALSERAGFFGAVLALVEAYEDGRWSDVAGLGGQLGIAPGTLSECYLSAVGWARERAGELSEPGNVAAVRG